MLVQSSCLTLFDQASPQEQDACMAQSSQHVCEDVHSEVYYGMATVFLGESCQHCVCVSIWFEESLFNWSLKCMDDLMKTLKTLCSL